MAESIVIVGAKRTPIGSMQGKFNAVSASQLGSVAIKAAIEQAGEKRTEVDVLIFGNGLEAGQGQGATAPAPDAYRLVKAQHDPILHTSSGPVTSSRPHA